MDKWPLAVSGTDQQMYQSSWYETILSWYHVSVADLGAERLFCGVFQSHSEFVSLWHLWNAAAGFFKETTRVCVCVCVESSMCYFILLFGYADCAQCTQLVRLGMQLCASARFISRYGNGSQDLSEQFLPVSICFCIFPSFALSMGVYSSSHSLSNILSTFS